MVCRWPDHLSRYDERGFWVNYNHLLLNAVGVHADTSVAEKIQDEFEHYSPQDVVFADTPLVLHTLQRAGYIVGLVSNRDHELDTLATQIWVSPISELYALRWSGAQFQTRRRHLPYGAANGRRPVTYTGRVCR